MKPDKRPNNLPGLLFYWLKLSVRRIGFWVTVLIVLVALFIVLLLLTPAPPVRVGTFNIQNYPQSNEQMVDAVAFIGTLEVDVLGLQEIVEPEVFRAATEALLGPQWEVLFAEQCDVWQNVGIMYDRRVKTLLGVRTHCETVVHRRARATLEARFRTNSLRGRYVRVFVVHLKAGGGNEWIRERQLEALGPIVAGAVMSGDEVILLGDFNSTSELDREMLRGFAASAGLEWATEALECTQYWDRREYCMASALDHVLGTGAARSVRARGPCESVGCDTRASCPTYVRRISDHCPVTAVY